MFVVIALAVGLTAILVATVMLLRRIDRTDPGIEGFSEFRDALRPALVRLEAASADTAKRRRTLPRP